MDERIKEVLDLAKITNAEELAYALSTYYRGKRDEAKEIGESAYVEWYSERAKDLLAFISLPHLVMLDAFYRDIPAATAGMFICEDENDKERVG